MTSKELIIERLKYEKRALAIHEFKNIGYSENNIATRLNELERAGKLISNYRKGEHYKEWTLVPEVKVTVEPDGQMCFV